MESEHVTYTPGFLTQEKSLELFEHLRKDISWTNSVEAPSGQLVKLNREVAYIADYVKPYFYANLKFTTPNGVWTPLLAELRDMLNAALGQNFNSVLLNSYRDGRDEIKWHSDKEFCLGENPVIACVNLGATRKFWLQEMKNDGARWNIPLNNGDLLVMNEHCQTHMLHAILKEKEVTEPRISLTFRECKA